MKFFADHCFFSCGVKLLRKHSYDIVTAKDTGLSIACDEDIAAFCNQQKRIILTMDNDFSSLYRFPLGTHQGIVVFRLKDFTPNGLLGTLAPIIQKHLFEQFQNALVIIRKDKIRIVRPNSHTEIL